MVFGEKGNYFSHTPCLAILLIRNFMGTMKENIEDIIVLMGKLWGKCTISGNIYIGLYNGRDGYV